MKKITIHGLVQGVGFRPFVKREADAHSVTGTVRNIGGIVEIIAEGKNEALENFIQCLTLNAPKGSIVTDVKTEEYKCSESDEFCEFSIAPSASNNLMPIIPPDIAVCPDCMEEFFDRNNRRYFHPFISCAACGPRYSIIKRLPYDRENTVMDAFPTCKKCEKEYNDAADRRFYAQTVCCPECGPRLSYRTADGQTNFDTPLPYAVSVINNGGIAAIKDIGGFHFACSAKNTDAVIRLRKLKGREKKPFAVMFESCEAIQNYALVSELEKQLLTSDIRPIVLLKKNTRDDFPCEVCGESMYIGAFLPCNPIQAMLVRDCGPLIMTSGNISGEPIITDNRKMLDILEKSENLNGVLLHDRDIETPLDDSIVRVICGRIQLVRRGRGYTPMPLEFTSENKNSKNILAAGSDMKASFCLASKNQAYMSQYFGDMSCAKALRALAVNTERMSELTGISPEIFAVDCHPLYEGSRLFKKIAAEKKVRVIEIQHHIAHAASVITEHGISGEVLAFSFDGTGFGDDGTVWGGEVFIYSGGKFKRVAHLKPIECIGGDETAKNSKTLLDCFLIDAGLEPVSGEAGLIKAALKAKVNTVKSSSMGRLFDAVSALLGICTYNEYEGQCASLLEKCASSESSACPLTLPCENGVYKTDILISEIQNAVSSGEKTGKIALGFHFAIADAVVETAEKYGIKCIALSGGVFMNKILTERCIDILEKKGYNVYINEKVPTNDEGIALGQVFAARNER